MNKIKKRQFIIGGIKYFLLVLLICVVSETASAYFPLVVTQNTLHDIVTIQNPEESQTFYGQMLGFPHTYEIQTDTPLNLFVEISVPDIDSSTNNISGIIVQQVEGSGRVKEVARLYAKEATWGKYFEPVGGDTYRRGPQFEKEIPPGVYRIEVNTPNNIEKYVLTVGKKQNTKGVGYIEMIRRITSVKVFFGKSQFLIIESPFVYIPTTILFLGIGVFWFRRRRRSKQSAA